MRRLSRRAHPAAVLLATVAAIFAVSPASADTGTIAVSATNNAKLTMTIGTSSANFGASLDPTGAGASGQASATAPSTSGDQGVYYVWSPSAPLVTVKSNKTWNGSMQATENTGSAASLSLASGALRFGTTLPHTYDDARNGSAFSSTATSWQANHIKGVSSFSYNYYLRVDWSDDPGTFNSTVTYTASQ
jgi:hypothetical protein